MPPPTKPWVICLGLWFNPVNWGRLVREHTDGGGFVRYSERQQFCDQAWGAVYLKKFAHPEQMLQLLLGYPCNKRRHGLRRYLIQEFYDRFPHWELNEATIADPTLIKLNRREVETSFQNWVADS